MGGKGGGGYVCEQRSVFPLLLIPHPQVLVLSIPILFQYLTAVLYSFGLANPVTGWPVCKFTHLFEFGMYDKCIYILCLITPSLSVKVSIGGNLANLAS